ncbi:MAG: hypothetical protein K2P58_00835 [Hyphomonadaceae bacterium]|nr:hypothetical protein [Hyphomonadaceae bacterium]
MRSAAVLLAFIALAACATAPPSVSPSGTQAAAAPAPASSRTLQLLSAAGADDAPTQAQIERALGEPDIVRRDGAGAALTYRLDSCALLLLFSADQRNAMRLAEAHASPRRTGDAPSLAQCAAEADVRRS